MCIRVISLVCLVVSFNIVICHRVDEHDDDNFVFKPKLHEHKRSIMVNNEPQRDFEEEKNNESSIKSVDLLGIDKLDRYFNEFKSIKFEKDLDALDEKKLRKHLLEVVNDVEQLLRKPGMVSDAKMQEFIDSGLRRIHKKLNLPNRIDDFLDSHEEKYDETRFVHESNSLVDEMIKTSDWNAKKNGPSKADNNNNKNKIQETDEKKQQSTYVKKPSYSNVKYMKKGYHDVHPKFNDHHDDHDDDNANTDNLL